jgi:hypothetical protein
VLGRPGEGVRGSEVKKVQLVLDDEAQDILEKLKESTRAESQAHVLRNALGVYAALYDLLKKGGPNTHLALVDRSRNEMQRLSVPSLEPFSVSAEGPYCTLCGRNVKSGIGDGSGNHQHKSCFTKEEKRHG